MDDENDGRICGASLLLVTEGSERDVSEEVSEGRLAACEVEGVIE